MKPRKITFSAFLILFSLVTVTVLVVVVGSLLHSKTKGFIENKYEHLMSIKLNQITTDLNNQFEDASRALDALRTNPNFLDTLARLESGETPSYQKFVQSNHLNFMLFNNKKDNDFISNVAVVTGTLQASSGASLFSYYAESKLSELFDSFERIVFVPAGQTYETLGIDRDNMQDDRLRADLDKLNSVVYMLGPIGNHGTDRPQGAIVYVLDLTILNHLIPYADSMQVLSENGAVLFRGAYADAGNGSRAYRNPIHSYGVSLVFYEATSDLQRQQLRMMGTIALFTIAASAVLAFVMTGLFGKSILLPLHKLIKWIGKYEQLNFKWDYVRNDVPSSRRWSIRDRLFAYFIMTIFVPILFFVILFYIQSTAVVSRELRQTYYAAFEKTVHRIELFIKQKKSVLGRLAYDPWVADFVSQSEDNHSPALDYLISAHQPSFINKDEFSVYNTDNELLYSNRNHLTSQIPEMFYNEMKSTRKRFYYYSRTDNGSSIVSIGMPVINLNLSLSPLGFITIDMDEMYFSSLYADLREDGGTAYIIDDRNHVLSHSDPRVIGRNEHIPLIAGNPDGYISNDSKLFFVGRIGDLPWYLVSMYDYSVVSKRATELIYNDIYLLIILFLLALLFSYVLSQHLVKPLASLHFRSLQIEFGEIRSLIAEQSYRIDEVDHLQQSFNRLFEKIGNLVEDKVEHERVRMLMQIDVLQAQIDPHFLHNTLEYIMYLVESDEKTSAVEMTGMVSRLLRYAMGKESPMTSVREEWLHTKAYADILNFRYKEMIRWDWSVDEDALDCRVLKMLLQPLIENAIRYSIPAPDSVLTIRIACRRQEDCIVFAVSDNGPGILPEGVEELRRQLRSGSRTSLGLHNVHNRIRLHFGERYGLSVESVFGQGTTVRLELPVLNEHAENRRMEK